LPVLRTAIKGVSGLEPGEWTPRETRQTILSPLSNSGVSLAAISRLVGHKSTAVSEFVDGGRSGR